MTLPPDPLADPPAAAVDDAAADPLLDAWLARPLLQPPADFEQRVLAALPPAPGPAPLRWPRRAWRGLAPWLATTGALLGVVEVWLFVSAAWSATALASG